MLLLAGISTVAQVAQAGTASDGTAASMPEEGEASPIVVTARRREESAQDVPIALTAIGADDIVKSGNYTLTQFQQLAPSLQVFALNPRNTNINIRGLGSNVATSVDGLDNGVGVYVDQVYLGRVGLSAFDLVDLQQIEVLRGPQGTLFGKNTTAGAINITSRAPGFDPGFEGELSAGNYGYHQVRASVTGGLIDDVLAVRLSGSDTHRDGFVRNIRQGLRAQDNDSSSLRGQILFKPTPDVSLRVIGDWARLHQRGIVQPIAGIFTTLDNGAPIANNVVQRAQRLGYTLPTVDPFARQADADGFYQIKMSQWGATAILDWTIPGNLITSVTAYRKWTWEPRNDADWLGIPVLDAAHTNNDQRQFSQELRIASTGDRPIDYVAGVYYFWQKNVGTGETRYGSAAPSWFLGASTPVSNATLNGFGARTFSNPVTNSYAAFGQATWHADDRLSVTAGLRYTHEKKRGRFVQTPFGPTPTGFTPAQESTIQGTRAAFARAIDYGTALADNSLSGTLNVAYALSDAALAYATYARGNKSGGLNLTALPAGVDPEVKPERVDHYELGFKSEWFDRRVTLNLAAFWTDVKGYQTAVTTTDSTFGFRQYIANADKVRSRGLEADLRVEPVAGLILTGSGTFVDITYRDFKNAPCPQEAPNLPSRVCDLGGQRVAGSSRYAAALGADYSAPITDRISAYGRADYSYRSNYYTAVNNSRYSKVPGYALVNLRAGLRSSDSRWDVSLWARNLFDKNYFQILTPADTGLVTGIVGDPRTWGATIRTSL
ncbi:TonB-dependent receptor [Sphingobium sp. HBC34]|uniref:TonB-dependent receptor n=1 Tax=Sphingobium cyanobacteriorum TaxID=3063954 RepID=A0ABT8ZM65_9SPHN|nr:TonB-dependent receptor [Sphingobium sp. HBC34]MDO7835637.1 TonB-dependent receptor [Sphingobium sp. HBC34]